MTWSTNQVARRIAEKNYVAMRLAATEATEKAKRCAMDAAIDNALDALAKLEIPLSKYACESLCLFRSSMTARKASMLYVRFVNGAASDESKVKEAKVAWRNLICQCIFLENGCISKMDFDVALQSSFGNYISEHRDLRSQMFKAFHNLTNTYSDRPVRPRRDRGSPEKQAPSYLRHTAATSTNPMHFWPMCVQTN